MAMIKQHCSSSCGKTTWHNPTKKDAPRCTYCGHPVSSNPSKREGQEGIRRKQVAKVSKI